MSQVIIIGDSFCANWPGWPRQFVHKIKNESDLGIVDSRLVTSGGAGIWEIHHLLRELIQREPKTIEDTSIAIIIHTNYVRPNTRNSSKLPRPHSIPFGKNNLNEEHMAVSLYYKYIHDDLFGAWAFEQWLISVEKYFPNKTKIYHFFISENSLESALGLRNTIRGQIIPTTLQSISVRQLDKSLSTNYTISERMQAEQENRFLNHFSEYNNEVLAQEIFDIVTGRSTNINPANFKLLW
jgi:hypothetical protein